MRTVDVDFNKNSRPRNKTQHLGSHTGYLNNSNTRPILQKLAEFESLALFDSTCSYGLFALIDTVISSLGEIEHPDPEIQDFCRENVARLGGIGNTSSPFYNSLYKILHSTMWAGFSVTENLFTIDKGALWIEDFVTYHPATITIRPNKKGRLVEGQPSLDTYKSGIWQTSNEGEVMLPMWKLILMSRMSMYGNYYGVSLLESIYKWSVLKDALLDMMTVALDRFGNPIVALTFPLYNTDQTKTDPDTGEEVPLNTQELLELQVQTNQFSGGGNVLLLPQVDKDIKPTAQVLTTGNNVGSTFLEAIKNCDMEMSRGMLMPYALLSNDIKTGGEASEQQMEMFNRVLKAVHQQHIGPILSQSFHRLIQFNFNRESAKIAPVMNFRQNTRPENRVALMQVISGLTDRGYFNPTEEADWSAVRNMVSMTERDQSKEDKKFIKDMIIVPKQPAPAGGASGNSSNSSRAKGTAGKKGTGSGAGRPVGSSAPKSKKSTK